MDPEPTVGDCKAGHTRMEIHSVPVPASSPSTSKAADEVEVSDQDRPPPRKEKGSFFRFPRLGLEVLLHESRDSGEMNEDGTFRFYKVYKRRWFGLVELTLLNIVVSWDVSGSSTHLLLYKTFHVEMDITSTHGIL